MVRIDMSDKEQFQIPAKPLPHVISGVGILLGLVSFCEGIAILLAPRSATVRFQGSVITSIPFIIGHIYGGYWLSRSGISCSRYVDVVKWWLTGMVGTAIVTGIVVFSSRAATIQLFVATVRWSIAVGGVMGLAVGSSRARSVQRALELQRTRRRKKQLERERDRLEEFASIVSHDLRGPLAVADGHINLLQEEIESPHLTNASSALTRMESIIEETLTLARAGRMVGETTPIEIRTLANECWRTVDTADATLVIEETVTVPADKGCLHRLFENLFRNAVQHGSEDVTVRVGVVDDDAGFYVADDGPGIPESQHDRVFESGFSCASQGSGLGLSIVRSIVKAHGWEIAVTDSEQGGARFEISGINTSGE